MFFLYEHMHKCHQGDDEQRDPKLKKLLSDGNDDSGKEPGLLDALAFMIAAEEDHCSSSSITVADSDDYEDYNDYVGQHGDDSETSDHHQTNSDHHKSDEIIAASENSGMSRLPLGADLGSVHTNCWGVPNHETFFIRGPRYLDKPATSLNSKNGKKIHSQEFLFPLRGAELFLTKSATAPTNVASNPSLLQGRVRDSPTFVVNFRLPWGIVVLYHEIPAKFVPYLRAGYESTYGDPSRSALEALLESETEDMTPAERCVCRYLLGNNEYKNQRLKIVPHVVRGPWVARVACNGKPAILGNMLPIQYTYQPPEPVGDCRNEGAGGDAPSNCKHLYLEADLDIASSSAARSILNVARTYTRVLTLDLGFVVQANEQDELPEQMLVGCQLHGVDPDIAPMYPYPSAQDSKEQQLSGLHEASCDTPKAMDPVA
mmetsp:Transcript_4275/g.8994  ORF Transcript_4275/g.8994 Transcript_4275/m.8994 type:complete len:430 (+) Transcript_4275:88-1377(+)